MWSSVRSTAARQLRVARAAKVNIGLSVSSRAAHAPASFVLPSSYRLVLSSRSFSDTSDQLEASVAAKTPAKAAAKKRPAAKKKPAVKKATAKKATATKRKVKAKKPVKKAAAKKRMKKVVTPEEKRKTEIRELKKVALLNEPKRLPDRMWLVYTTQHMKGATTNAFGDLVKSLSVDYKTISAAEKERLQTTAAENHLINQAAYKAWVESHSPVEIDAANRARARLRRISNAASKLTAIKDDRLPKRATTAYAIFVRSKWQSGEFAGTTIPEASTTMAREWKSLPAGEKKAYEDIAAADSARYARDVKSVLNRDVSP